MSLRTWLRGLRAGVSEGNEAPPEPESRCWAFVTLVGGLQGVEPRARHLFKGEATCRRCGVANPAWRAEVVS